MTQQQYVNFRKLVKMLNHSTLMVSIAQSLGRSEGICTTIVLR